MENDIKSLKELAHGAGISFVLGIAAYVIMFLFKLIAARYLGPSDFGVFSLVETILMLSILVGSLGIDRGILRYIPYYKKSGKRKLLFGYLRFVKIIPLISSLVLGSIIFIFSKQITIFFNFPQNFSLFLKIVAIVIPFKVLDRTFRKYLLANKKIIYAKSINAFIERGLLLAGILFIWFFKLSLIYLILLFSLTKILAFFLDFYFSKTKVKLPKISNPKYRKKEWLYFSLPLFFSGIFAFFIRWTDNLVIGKILEPASLGIYSVVFSFATFLLFFQKSFIPIFMPLISENYGKKNKKRISFLFKKSAAWVFGLTFPLFLIIILYSKEVLVLLYGKEYAAGYLPLIILSMGVLINISTGLSGQILMLHKKTKYLFYINATIAVFNVTFNIILIPILGITGAAISSAVSMGLQNLIFLYLASNYEKLSFDWIYYIKFIVAGIPSILIAASIFRTGLNIFISVPTSLIIYAGAYLFFLILLRTFTKEDFKIILAVEKKLGLNLKFLKRMVMKFY